MTNEERRQNETQIQAFTNEFTKSEVVLTDWMIRECMKMLSSGDKFFEWGGGKIKKA